MYPSVGRNAAPSTPSVDIGGKRRCASSAETSSSGSPNGFARPTRPSLPTDSLADRESRSSQLAADLARLVFLRVDVDVRPAGLECAHDRYVDLRLAASAAPARRTQRDDHRTGFATDAAVDV